MRKSSQRAEADKARRRNRKLAAALGFVATAGVLGVGGTTENSATWSVAAEASRPIVVAPRDGKFAKPSAYKAFLVAADNYGSAATALPCAKNDVKALKTRLGALGFTTTVLETGGDPQYAPTKTTIERRFKEFVESLKPGDFVIVYLSGHGIQPANSDKSFFAPVDVDVKNLFDSSVSINQMLDDLKASDASFRWMLVDACRDDPLNPADDSGAPAIKDAAKSFGARALGKIANVPDSVALLQSCQPGESSYEGGGPGATKIKNGFFTLSLLEALDEKDSKADANRDGVLSFLEATDYVSRRTYELASTCYGESQTPNLSGSITNFALLDGLRVPTSKPEGSGLLTLALLALTGGMVGFAVWAFRLQTQIKKLGGATQPPVAPASVSATQFTPVSSPLVVPPESEARAESERKAREAAKRAAKVASQAKNGWDAEYKAGTRKTLNVKGIEYAFRYCPPGTFTMGSPESEEGRHDDETQHKVTLTNGFWLLETPVTQAMWKSVMGTNPSYFSSTGGGASRVSGLDTSNFPVERVSWEDCQEFIEKLNSFGLALNGFRFRFPSEAEWEYACRAGTTTPYFWGSSLNGDKANCDGNNPCGTLTKGACLERTTKVGSYAANPWGLFDMHGNVWEWCADWYDDEYYKKTNNAQNPICVAQGSFRVLRGGGWHCYAKSCRSALRSYYAAAYRSSFYGFRLALGREL